MLNHDRVLRVIVPALSLLPAILLADAPVAQDEPQRAEATLRLEPTRFDIAGTRSEGLMYMPSSAAISAEKPAVVTKEPAYSAEPRYAVIALGNGPNANRAIAIDVPSEGDARIWLDLNGDGDLTNDNDGAWTEKKASEGAAPNYSGTWVFDVTWVADDGGTTTGPYGINFYWSPDRGSLNYYRAAARVGEIRVGDASYKVTLLENDADALFDKAFDPSGATVVGEKMTKPVWLMLDGDRFDVRGTFQFAGMNWQAKVSLDGSQLSMAPTMKVVRAPEPAERPKMLGAGGDAPEFEARMMGADGEESVFSLADFEGQSIVVLDLWATWCGPCRAGLPHLSKLAEKTASQGVTVIALNSYDDEPAYQRFVTEKAAELPGIRFARDPAGRESEATIAKRLFSVTGIPATYVIDKTGKITAVVSGYQEGDRTLENALKKLGVSFE